MTDSLNLSRKAWNQEVEDFHRWEPSCPAAVSEGKNFTWAEKLPNSETAA